MYILKYTKNQTQILVALLKQDLQIVIHSAIMNQKENDKNNGVKNIKEKTESIHV